VKYFGGVERKERVGPFERADCYYDGRTRTGKSSDKRTRFLGTSCPSAELEILGSILLRGGLMQVPLSYLQLEYS